MEDHAKYVLGVHFVILFFFSIDFLFIHFFFVFLLFFFFGFSLSPVSEIVRSPLHTGDKFGDGISQLVFIEELRLMKNPPWWLSG